MNANFKHALLAAALGVVLPCAAQPAGTDLGVVVDDQLYYSDGAAAARTPARLARDLQASGRFSSVALNRFDRPLQLRVRIDRKSAESEAASTGKLFAGAATLFLLPIKENWAYSFEFDLECRGQTLGQWRYRHTVEQTQFVLADPAAGQSDLMKDMLARFVQDVSDQGALSSACR